jgi:uncharacterized protein YhbP (UPF0306 family)
LNIEEFPFSLSVTAQVTQLSKDKITILSNWLGVGSSLNLPSEEIFVQAIV